MPNSRLVEVLAQCPDARQSPDGWRASCPVHGGESGSSLHLWDDDGDVRVHCFGGCDFREVRAYFGLEGSPPHRMLRPHQREYRYQDAKGRHTFSVIAHREPGQPKAFRQCRPDPLGGQILWNMHGVERVLYHLPQLLNAPLETLVYVVEGEKDVENLEALGYVATTNPGGAKKWLPQYTASLQGRRVVVLPDNDKPGEEHAQMVAHALSGVAAHVSILDLPGLKRGGDVSDWLAAGGTKDLLDTLTREVLAVEEAEHRSMLISMDMVEEEEVDWLWWPYIMRGALTMVDGDPGQGKSLLTLALAAHLSRGTPLPDQQGCCTITVPQGRSLFFAEEDSPSTTVAPRLKAMNADRSQIHIVDPARAEQLAPHQQFSLQNLAPLEWEIAKFQPLLIVIDPLQSYLGAKVDMNRANEVRPLVRGLARLAAKHHVAILCVRHAAKGGGGEGSRAMMRGLGSVDFVAAARTALYVEEHPTVRTQALLCHTKSNVSARGRTLIFSRDEGRFEWAGLTRLTDEDIAGSGRGPNPRERLKAAFWLEKRLSGGHQWPASDIAEEALEEYGISSKQLFAAREILGVETKKEKNVSNGGWLWRLPEVCIIKHKKITQDTSSSSDTTDTTSTTDSSPLTRNLPHIFDSTRNLRSLADGVDSRKAPEDVEDSLVDHHHADTPARDDTRTPFCQGLHDDYNYRDLEEGEDA